MKKVEPKSIFETEEGKEILRQFRRKKKRKYLYRPSAGIKIIKVPASLKRIAQSNKHDHIK